MFLHSHSSRLPARRGGCRGFFLHPLLLLDVLVVLVQSFVVKPRFRGVSPFVIKTISIHIHRDNFFGSVVEWILSVMFRRDNNLHFWSQYGVVYSFDCLWSDSKNFTHNFIPDTCRAQLLVNIKVAAKIGQGCAIVWQSHSSSTVSCCFGS